MINDVEVFKVDVDSHAYERLKQRLDRMAKNHDITDDENNTIRNNLNAIISYGLKPTIDFGIFLGEFKPQPISRLYTITNSHDPNIPFYEIYSEGHGDIMVDSTGDEFWAIIRKNRLKTVMLRKKLQRRSADKERNNDGGLGVDKVIWDVNEFITKQEEKKEKIVETPKEKENTVNINGVLWVVDNSIQKVYKKNKPSISVVFNQILDNPDWSDKIKEEIMKYI